MKRFNVRNPEGELAGEGVVFSNGVCAYTVNGGSNICDSVQRPEEVYLPFGYQFEWLD